MSGAVRNDVMDLVGLLEESALRYRDLPLFGTKSDGSWRWTTYGQFAASVARCRKALAEWGLGQGDRLAIVSNNRVEWAMLAHAAMGLGASFVPMYESDSPKEWLFITEDCGAKMLVVSTEKILHNVIDFVRRIPALEVLHCMEFMEFAGPDVGRSAEKAVVPPRRPDPDEVACIIYTSGTTGRPKGVKLSHRNIASNVSAVRRLFPLTEQDRCLSFLPWAHSFGQTCELHAFMSIGASIAICEGVDKIVPNLAEVQPTVLCAVPRIFNKIYANVQQQVAGKPLPVRKLFDGAIAASAKQRSGGRLTIADRFCLGVADKLIFSKVRRKFGGKLRYAISGGAALAKEVAEFIDTLGLAAYEGYGLSETSPIVSCTYPGVRKLGTVGKVLAGVRVEIDKNVVGGNGEDGEIVVHGPNVMLGYHNRPEEDCAVFTADRGLRTGDIGRIDSDGFLRITGRIKEQYKLENGKYVVPAPLEEKLKLSPFIANVMVYGANRPYNVALVVPDAQAVRAWARDKGATLGADITQEPGVLLLMMQEFGKYSADFKGFEKVRTVALLAEDFTQENGLLTPTLKLKRSVATERFKEDIEKLYAQQR